MFRFVPRIAAVLLLVVAGTVAPAAAEERPFNASGAGYVTYDQYNLVGSGEATHLGGSFLEVGLQLDLYSYHFVPDGASLTSANGDVLTFDFDVVYPRLFPVYRIDPATGVVSATLTFTGGTGRFQDATGHADVMFVFDPILEQFLFLVDGTIDY